MHTSADSRRHWARANGSCITNFTLARTSRCKCTHIMQGQEAWRQPLQERRKPLQEGKPRAGRGEMGKRKDTYSTAVAAAPIATIAATVVAPIANSAPIAAPVAAPIAAPMPSVASQTQPQSRTQLERFNGRWWNPTYGDWNQTYGNWSRSSGSSNWEPWTWSARDSPQ